MARKCNDLIPQRRTALGPKEAERIGERIRPIRTRPWPERPVSAANKSGYDHPATRQASTYWRTLDVPAGKAQTQRHFLYLIDYMMLPNRGMEIRCLMPPANRVAA